MKNKREGVFAPLGRKQTSSKKKAKHWQIGGEFSAQTNLKQISDGSDYFTAIIKKYHQKCVEDLD